MEKPTFQEWKKINPSKGVNEYFQNYPNHQSDFQSNASVRVPVHTIPVFTEQIEKETIDFASIFASLIILIAFFLPWIDVKILGLFDVVKSTGFELPKTLDALIKERPLALVNSLYLIPLGAFIVVISSIKNSWIKCVAQIFVIFICAYWFIIIKDLVTSTGSQLRLRSFDPFKVISYGFYLTMLGCVYYAWNCFAEIILNRD